MTIIINLTGLRMKSRLNVCHTAPPCMSSGMLSSKTLVPFLFFCTYGMDVIALTYINQAGLHMLLQNMFPCFCQILLEHMSCKHWTLSLYTISDWSTGALHASQHSLALQGTPPLTWPQGSTNFSKTWEKNRRFYHVPHFPKAAYIKVTCAGDWD